MRLKFGEFSNIEYLLESFLEAIAFCLIEPISLRFFPYTCGDSGNSSEGDRLRRERHPGNEISESELCGVVQKLATESIDIHSRAETDLEEVATCKHGRRSTSQWVCEVCASRLARTHRPLGVQNPVVGRFLNDALRLGEKYHVFTRHTARIISYLVQRRVSGFELYMKKLSAKIHKSSLDYWRAFGKIEAPTDNSVATSTTARIDKSAYVFPGRKRCRDGISFDSIDKQECTKHYFKGRNSAVPSFLTVQCACAHPKLLVFVVLRRCESISAALSSVLTNFPVPPRVIWYDNACNTYDSGILRIPWLLRWSRLVVDIFHYTSHNYCNILIYSTENF